MKMYTIQSDQRDGSCTSRVRALIKHLIRKAATTAPAAYLQYVLPPVLEIIAAHSEAASPDRRLRFDVVWRWRDHQTGYHLAPNLMLGLPEDAIRVLAERDPVGLRPILNQLKASDFETAHFLLLRAYSANGAALADESIQYLLSEPEAVSIGYRSGDSFAAIEAIHTASAHANDDNLRLLEEFLLRYHDPWEQTPSGMKLFGHTQFKLMSAIDPSRRSVAVQKRIRELEHKFGPEASWKAPPVITGGAVPSPIPSRALSKMSDDQWLSALAEYTSQISFRPWRGVLGGALQVSQDLLSQTRNNPNRFARLLLRFPSDVHPYYIGETLLRGLCESSAQPDVILNACSYLFGLPHKPGGNIIPDCVAKLAKSDLPEDALRMVAWYATEDPNPTGDCSSKRIETRKTTLSRTV